MGLPWNPPDGGMPLAIAPAEFATAAQAIAVLAGDRSGSAMIRLLECSGLPAVAVDADALSAHIRAGTSNGAVVTGEMLRPVARRSLLNALADQPAWSDFPIVVVAAKGQRPNDGPARSLPNAVVVTRPLRCDALLSAAGSASRARRRQRAAACAGNGEAAEIDRTEHARMLHASRLSAMSEMASALAHEVNQPLSASVSYVAGCRRLLTKAAHTAPDVDLRPLLAALATAEAETMRAGVIVRNIRKTLAMTPGMRQPSRLDDIVHQACAIVGAEDPSVTIDVRILPGNIRVSADRVALRQVVVSLIKDRCGASNSGDLRRVLVATRPSAPGFVELRVSSAVPTCYATAAAPAGGAPVDDLRITLSICRTIVESHGGAFHVDPSGGETCVAFTLPLDAIGAL